MSGLTLDDDDPGSPRPENLAMDLEGEDNSPHSASSLSLGCPTIHRNELELLCSIGEGGFCEVWEGRWFGAPVAVKKLKVTDDAKADADAALDFLAEIQLHSHLAFPLLVPVLGCCVAPDPRDVWLVMEQAPLGSLFGILHVHDHRTKPLDMPLALRTCLAADCASAVAYVHARGIVHRDIKSMNVLVFQGWRLKLCDFGLAVPVASCGAPFPKQRGTYAWMAPESMTDKIYGFASDVFALAVLVFELAKRRLPFDGASNDAISAAVAGRGERPSLAEVAGVDEHVPLAVQDVLEAGWAQDPLARPHASEMEDALRRIGDERFGGDPRNDALLLELNIDLSAQLPDELGDDGLGGRGHGARDGGEDGGNGLDSGGGGGGGEADAPGPRAKESGELPVDAGGARGGSSAGARGSVADNAADGDGEPGSGGEPESARVGLLRQALTSPTAADIEARGGGRGGGGAPPVSAVGGGAGGAGADRGSSQQFFSPLGGGDHWACYREGLADTPRQNATAATTPAAAAGGAGAGGHSPEASARGGAQPHADRQPRDASARGPAAAAAANSTPAAATLAPVRTGGGSGSGGGVLASPVRRWDDGLDVAMLKVAFQEMAESGVIFERSKELSLHLSRSQAKPFVHNSETGQSVFLDEEGVAPGTIAEANAIMHKLIRHYNRRKQHPHHSSLGGRVQLRAEQGVGSDAAVTGLAAPLSSSSSSSSSSSKKAGQPRSGTVSGGTPGSGSWLAEDLASPPLPHGSASSSAHGTPSSASSSSSAASKASGRPKASSRGGKAGGGPARRSGGGPRVV